jgi:predicted PurR-regulated permease PerM
MVRGLSKRGMGRGAATAIVFVGLLAGLALGGLLLGSLASAELMAALEELPRAYDAAARWLAVQPGWQGELGATLPPTARLVDLLADRQISDLGGFALGLTSGLFTSLLLLLSVASLGFYWLLEQPSIERLWLSLLPLQGRVPVRAAWKQIYAEIGRYVRQVAVIIVLTTVILGSLYSALAVPGAAILAILGGIAQVVPLLGIPLALLPAVVALATRDPLLALVLLVLGLLALGIIRGLIGPRLLRKGISVNPLLVIILILALAQLGGLASIVLAPPLAAAIQTALRIFASEQRSAQLVSPAAEYEALSQQLAALELRESAPDSPQIQSFIGRARSLLARSMGGG